jgi:PIN domain nuclease of toxin-antitoxin system
VRLLLDTHVALWVATDSPRLSAEARLLTTAGNADLFVSKASLWEVAIKYSRRRGRPNDMPVSSAQLLSLLRGARCTVLEIEGTHLDRLEQLPWLHRDPFDRLLVAQAIAEPLRLLTVDAEVAAYGAPVERV